LGRFSLQKEELHRNLKQDRRRDRWVREGVLYRIGKSMIANKKENSIEIDLLNNVEMNEGIIS